MRRLSFNLADTDFWGVIFYPRSGRTEDMYDVDVQFDPEPNGWVPGSWGYSWSTYSYFGVSWPAAVTEVEVTFKSSTTRR
jgi:hypothetical protein